MKRYSHFLIVTVIIFCSFISATSFAQGTWGSWAHKIAVKGYEGHRFRMEAKVRADVFGDNAAARLWARVDKPGNDGFFYNMQDAPIQDNSWKTYKIEGIIDSGAERLVVGALLTSEGKFYYDDFKIEVETEKDKWETVFVSDFENGLAEWEQGIGRGTQGINDSYKATVIEDPAAKSKVLFIQGD